MSAVYSSPAFAHPATPPSRIALLMHGMFCFLIKSSNQPAARVPRPLEEPGAILSSVLCSANPPSRKLTTIPDHQFDPRALTQIQYCGQTVVQALRRQINRAFDRTTLGPVVSNEESLRNSERLTSWSFRRRSTRRKSFPGRFLLCKSASRSFRLIADGDVCCGGG